jgi:hypothetical protein
MFTFNFGDLMIIFTKGIVVFLLLVLTQANCIAAEIAPYDLKVFIGRSGAGFQVQASYLAPVNECEAYTFLTDYEGAKNIPGIKESKIIHRVGNQVRVERIVEERVLFFPINLRSILEFSEVSDRRLDFTQIEGDAKAYKGSWVIEPDKNGTRFKHQATFELETSIPLFLIKHFLENSATRRFELMAERAAQQKPSPNSDCKKSTFL